MERMLSLFGRTRASRETAGTRRTRSLKIALGLALLALPALAQENYSQWAKYRVLTLNTTSSGGGANTSANVTGFPLLVRLTAAHADVFADAKAGGADLRFTKANGATRLAHEIEHWDSAGRSAIIWVRLDTAYGNNATQAIRLHWGRPAAADSSSPASVFRTADNYQGVWHLGGLNDATANASNGTNTNSTDTAGIMGRGRHFNGTNAYISVGNPDGMNSSQPFTIEGWVNWQSIGTGSTSRYRPLMTHGTSGTDGSQVFLQPRRPSSGGTAPYYSFGYYTGSSQTAVTNDVRHETNVQADSGTWVQITGVYDGTNWILYHNGRFSATTARSGNITHATNRNWFIGGGDGNNATTPSRFYFGKIDEVRFSNAVRDSHWVRLGYETQKEGATALAIGATQTMGPAALGALAYADSGKAADTLTFSTGAPVNVAPVYRGGPADSFKVVGTALPAGLSVNKGTGVLSGTPSAPTAAANYTVRAWGHFSAGDSVSRTVRITVQSGALANFRYNPDTTTYAAGLPIAPNAPSHSGRAPTKFQVTAGSLPAGLALDSGTGVISGSPTTAAAAANVTIRATNTSGPDTATRVLRFTIVAEDYSTWAQRDTLWLNTTIGNGAGTSALVTGFPVLVRLDSSIFANLYVQSSGRGADLRFLKGTANVRLPHQIETWDSTARTAAVWVLVDSVKANDRTQTVRMLWGKAGAPNASSGPSVFDTARFEGVWHFSEGAGADTALDATANNLWAAPERSSATNYAVSPEDTVGLIGRARRYGTNSSGNPSATSASAGNNFIVPNSAAGPLNFPENGTYSVSAWVNVPAVGTSRSIVSKGDRQYYLELRSGGRQWEFTEYQAGVGYHQTLGDTVAAGSALETATNNQWQHLVGVRSGAGERLYWNGVVVDSTINVDAGTTSARTTNNLAIGRNPTSTGSRYWRGKLDEIRIMSVSRSADWVKLEYHNQRAAQTLVWWVQPPAVNAVAGGLSARSELPGLTARNLGQVLLFQIEGGVRERAALSLMDLQGRVVWSGAFAPGAASLLWDGTAASGARAAAGVYAARLTLMDKAGKVTGVAETSVPFTP